MIILHPGWRILEPSPPPGLLRLLISALGDLSGPGRWGGSRRGVGGDGRRPRQKNTAALSVGRALTSDREEGIEGGPWHRPCLRTCPRLPPESGSWLEGLELASAGIATQTWSPVL